MAIVRINLYRLTFDLVHAELLLIKRRKSGKNKSDM